MLVSVLVVAASALLVRDWRPEAKVAIPPSAGTGHEVELPAPGSLAFEPNMGQTDEQVRFLARGQGYTLFLTDTDVIARLETAGSLIGMTLANANPAPRVTGELPMTGKSSYFIGNDPANWHRDVPRFAKVRYEGVYPGIDAVYYGNEGELEYDFVVEPGADPGVIAVDFAGADALSLDPDGNLIVAAGDRALVQRRPVVYQMVEGVRRLVEGAYRLVDDDTVGFVLGAFDPALPLTIDPVLGYSSYLGGDGYDAIHDIDVDAAGNIWIVGSTWSTEFEWNSSRDSEYSGNGDGYVCRLNAAGHSPTCAYLGGEANDFAHSIAIGPNGDAYVTGTTDSQYFPTANAHQWMNGGGDDTFVLRINAEAEELVFSTLFGGSGDDLPEGLAVDGSGTVFVAGYTSSTDLPVTPGSFQASAQDAENAYVVRFDGDGTRMFGTYLGGAAADWARGITLGLDGHPYIAGYTASMDFPVASAFQASAGGGGDAFLTRLHRDGHSLLSSTYLGGDNRDLAVAVTVDPAGRPTLVGLTNSYDFPLARPLYPALAQGQGEFVTQFVATGNELVFSSYLAGYTQDYPEDVATDVAGNIYIAGQVFSSDFPLNGTLTPRIGDWFDGFVMKISAGGQRLLFSSAVSGTGTETFRGLVRDLDGNIFVAGWSDSTDFPVAAALQPGLHENADAVLVRISEPALRSWRGDFNGDGVDDILWRNNATGRGTIWHSGNSGTAANITRVTNLSWRIVGVGDFDGDGRSDLLWRNAATGGNTIWRSGNAATSQSTTGVTNLNWEVHGIGDFNADGRDDIVWHNTLTGQTALWHGGDSRTASVLVSVKNLAWDIVGAGDFDGNGVDDLLWRNSSTGQNAIWKGADYRTPLAISGIAGHHWQIAGIADFQGDGQDDIVWRNMGDGRNAIWQGGSSARSQGVTAVRKQSWRIVGTGDYTGDGKADLLWRDSTTGANVIWRSATAATSKAVTGVRDQAWVPKS